MKLRKFITLLSFLSIVGCGLFNPEVRYTPKSSAEYYFPPLSEKTKKEQADCMRLENFPCDFRRNDTLSDFVNEWYSTHLASMKEPILYNQIDKDKKVIRFTHLGTWSQPYSYRIENNNGQILGTYSKTNGLGGYDAGNRIKHEQKNINLSDWEELLKNVNENFWTIQTHDPNMILDGEEWILEVLIDNKYHVVSRNSPDNYGGEKYAEICNQVKMTYSE